MAALVKKDKGSGASSSGHHGQRGCGVHLGSSSSTDQGRVSEGQAADTHTSWIQFHGTGVHAALTALGGNLLCKSENKRGKAAPEQQINTNIETSVGRGVYTSGRWGEVFELLRSTVVPGSEVLL